MPAAAWLLSPCRRRRTAGVQSRRYAPQVQVVQGPRHRLVQQRHHHAARPQHHAGHRLSQEGIQPGLDGARRVSTAHGLPKVQVEPHDGRRAQRHHGRAKARQLRNQRLERNAQRAAARRAAGGLVCGRGMPVAMAGPTARRRARRPVGFGPRPRPTRRAAQPLTRVLPSAPSPGPHLTARFDTLGTMRVAWPPAGSSIARKMLASPAQR
jgi:hypothetical protein